QPAKNKSAVAKKTGFAPKVDIFQDRHLLSSATRAIPRFFLHRTAPSVKFEARCWNWKFTPPVLAIWTRSWSSTISWPRSRVCAIKSIATTTWFISRSINPPSPFARFARSFANSRSIHISSAQFRESFAQKQKRSRWVSKHNSKCSFDSLTRWEDHSYGSFSTWARSFSWPRTRSAHFLRIGCDGNYFSTKLSKSDCFRN